MELVSYELHESIAVVQLSHKITNAINLKLVEALASRLAQVRQDAHVRGLVLSSANRKFFSIGFDIPQLYDLDQEGFKAFYQAFYRLCLDLYTLAKPSLALLNGHAIAGGCILALCCDYRYVAAGRTLIGLNEIKLGVPVPYLADQILGALVGYRQAREIMESGDFYPAEAAHKLGLVDRVLPPDQTLTEAITKLRTLGAMTPEAYEIIKRNRVEPIVERVETKIREADNLFIHCWYLPETRRRLREAMAKF